MRTLRAALVFCLALASSSALAQTSARYQTFKTQSTAPPTPSANYLRLYFDNTGTLKQKNSSGTVSNIGGGSSFYQTIQANGSDQTQRDKLNFGTMFSLTDSASPSRTSVFFSSTAMQSIYDASGTATITLNSSGFILDGNNANANIFSVIAAASSFRVYDTDDESVQVQALSIGTNTNLNAAYFRLNNYTAATNGNQKFSPALAILGQGWGTTGGASQAVAFFLQNRPVQGTTATGDLVFSKTIDNGSAADVLTLNTEGKLTLSTPALGTTAGTHDLIQNTTAATNGNQQISPSRAWEGRGWSTGSSVSRTVGMRMYLIPEQSTEPTSRILVQALVGNGSYTSIGSIGAYNSTPQGIKIGSVDGTSEYMSIDGPLTGFQWVVGGASQWFMDGTSYYPSGDATDDVGKSANRVGIVWSRTLISGDTSGNQPACNSTNRGGVYTVRAAGGASDTFQVCMKAAADTYAWRTVFTAP